MSKSNSKDLLDEIAELSKDLSEDLDVTLVAPQDMIGRYAPLSAPPDMTEKIHTGEGLLHPDVSAMEQLGYMYLDGSIPAGDKVHEIKTAFDEGPRIIDGPTSHIEGGNVCYEVLESGIQEKLEKLARRELRAEFVISQGPVILGNNPDATDLGHKVAHPLGEKGISFIRLVPREINSADVTIAPTAGAFVIYESSHSAVHFDKDAPFVQPTVTPRRLFILRGALHCKIRPPHGCMLVWAGFSTEPILEAKRRLDVFPFMVNYQRRMQLPEPGSRRGPIKYRDYTKKRAI